MAREEERSAGPDERLLQFKISLAGSNPEIWRRFCCGSENTFFSFHEIIQAVMGWSNEHLFLFRGKEWEIAPSGTLENDDSLDADIEEIGAYFLKAGEKMDYVYDFGDGWEHEIVFEQVLDGAPDCPKCLGGERACPPESCGGLKGYEQLLEAFVHPNAPENKALQKEARHLKPEYFSVSEANARLSALLDDEADLWEEEDGYEQSYGALIVIPLQPFLDWAKRCRAPGKNEVVRPSCWLIPPPYGFADEEEFNEFLERLKPDLLREELKRCTHDSTAWPKEISAALFDRYFRLELHAEARPVTELSEDYEDYFQAAVPDKLLDTIAQAIIEQRETNTPPAVRETFERLMRRGMKEEECFQLVSTVFGVELWHMEHDDQPFNEQRYTERLNLLPDLSWLDEEDGDEE